MANRSRQSGVSTIVLVILAAVLILGFFVGLIVNRQERAVSDIPDYTSTPEVEVASPTAPVVSQNDTILRDLAESGIDCDDKCTVDKVSGNYAKGTLPGGYFLAVKLNNRWQAVVRGNGLPPCSEIDNQEIPREIYGNCIDTTGELRFSPDVTPPDR